MIALGPLLWLAGSSGAALAAIVKNLSTGIVNSTGSKIGNKWPTPTT